MLLLKCASFRTASHIAPPRAPPTERSLYASELTGCAGARRLGRLSNFQEGLMSLGTILLIVLILALVGALPTWPHSRSWGYAPSGTLGVVLIVVVLLFALGRL